MCILGHRLCPAPTITCTLPCYSESTKPVSDMPTDVALGRVTSAGVPAEGKATGTGLLPSTKSLAGTSLLTLPPFSPPDDTSSTATVRLSATGSSPASLVPTCAAPAACSFMTTSISLTDMDAPTGGALAASFWRGPEVECSVKSSLLALPSPGHLPSLAPACSSPEELPASGWQAISDLTDSGDLQQRNDLFNPVMYTRGALYI